MNDLRVEDTFLNTAEIPEVTDDLYEYKHKYAQKNSERRL
jgi:hypothetical protein